MSFFSQGFTWGALIRGFSQGFTRSETLTPQNKKAAFQKWGATFLYLIR
jgi:hypothetical protein